jgi:hypothetical protein
MQEDFAIADEPVRRSYLMFFFHALGIKYSLLLPLAGLIVFIVVLVLVIKGKGTALPAALLLLVPLPLLIGIAGVVEGLMASLMVISSSDTVPKASAVAEGLSMSLVTAWVGLWMMAPSYLLATIGMCVRSLMRVDGSERDSPVSATIVPSKP